ncbi:MAG TPA: Vms1/Ankzf1 family peptidyl-tRNA hydrolase [bacterium]|nr:Vms1/Ankzf1 family peptidyl-tRNA hydrolase [bacterium]
MISRKQVIDLLQFDAGPHQVVSFYMGIGVARAQRKANEIVAKDITKQAVNQVGLAGDARKDVEEDVQKILNFIKMDFKGKARGLAIFSSTKAGLWQVYRLPVTMPDRCVINHSPFVLPMLRIVDESRRFCVVVADTEKARLFTMYLGEIIERSDVFDVVPGWHKQGGWSQARFQRHIEDLVNRHLKHVADTVFELHKSEGFGHLIVGGSQEVRTRLLQILHSYLQKIIAGYINVDVTSSTEEILRAARKIEAEVEDKRSEEIVKVVAGATGRGHVVTGIDSTVAALKEGRVHTLVLVDDGRVEGCLCGDCGGVDVLSAEVCSRCKKPLSKAENVSEHLAVLAIEQDAEVKYVRPGSGMERQGSVGAILRW